MFSLGEDMLPYLPIPTVVNRVRMTLVIIALGASMRPGDYCQNVQVDIVHKTTSWYDNAHNVGAAHLEASLGDDKSFASASEWYMRQAGEMKLRMGVVRFQNDALTSLMVLALDDILKNEWNRSMSNDRHEIIEELISFVLIRFGSGLRGEQVPLISLRGLLHF